MALEDKDIKYRMILVPVVIGALSALLILAGTVPLKSFWGINNLRYFSSGIRIFYAVIIIFLFIPRLRLLIIGFLSTISKIFPRLPGVIRYLIVAIMSGIIFYLFRVHVHSLGDGYMRIGQIETGLRFLHTELLDFWLHGALYDLLNHFDSVSGEAVYQIFSIGIGMIFVLIIYGLDLKDITPGNSSAALKWLITCFGGAQLFFGYVESYALFYTAMIIYALLAYRYLLTGRKFWQVSLAYSIGLAAHMAGFIFLPTYLYLAYKASKGKKEKPVFSNYLFTGLVGLLAVTFIIMEIVTRIKHGQYLPSASGYLLPLFSGDYSVFAGHHLFDILNELLLVIPGPLAFIVPIIWSRQNNSQVSIKAFGILMILCAVFFLVAINPTLGYARDWDLFSTPTALLGCTVLVFYFRKMVQNNTTSLALPALLATAFVSVWILTNATPQRQLRRAEDLLSLSDQGRGYCTELLAHYYRYEAKDNQKVLDLLGSITGPARNARVLRIMAVTQYEMGHYANALVTAREGIAQDSTDAELNYVAGMSLTELGFADSATSYLEVAQRHDSRNYIFARSLAKNYYSIGRVETALEGYKYAISLDPKKYVGYFDVAVIYLEHGQLDSAFVYAQAGLKVAPDYQPGYDIMDAIKAAARNGLQRP